MTPDLAAPASGTHLSHSPNGGSEDADDARNRMLRRCDWRFLVSSPNPAVSVVDGEGTLADAVRAVSQRVVDATREQRPDAMCDLAVGQEPDEATLRVLWSALRPGGLVLHGVDLADGIGAAADSAPAGGGGIHRRHLL